MNRRERTITIPPNSTLWGKTTCDGWVIPIFKKNVPLKGFEAVTYTEKADRTPYIVFSPELLKKPEKFDEDLIHEFFHVIESLMAHELRKEDPEQCSQWARVGGRCMTEMLRNLKQVDPAKT